MMMQNNQIYILCAREKVNEQSPASLRNGIQRLIDGLRRFADQALGGLVFHAGFGKIFRRLTEAGQCFKEACQVIEVSQSTDSMKSCCFYEDMGIYQLLKAVPDSFLRAFLSDHLGKLITYDQTHHLDLVHTLSVYFRYRGSKGETASQLYIHRQTLYNRLDKIKAILGENFFDPDKRYCLEMALLSYEMLGNEKTDQTDR
jgi:purine catabolism regulator